MELRMKRSQRSAGLMGGKVKFALEAQLLINEEERSLIKKYGLGKNIVFSSEAAQKRAASALTSAATGNLWGAAKGAVSAGLAMLSFKITVDSLTRGQTIELNELEELLAAEEGVVEACQTTKAFLAAAATFDGQEVVMAI